MVSHTHAHILKSIRLWLAEEFVKVQHVQISENEQDIQNGRLPLKLRQLLYEAGMIQPPVCVHKLSCMSVKKATVTAF